MSVYLTRLFTSPLLPAIQMSHTESLIDWDGHKVFVFHFVNVLYITLFDLHMEDSITFQV